jgi:chromosome segregation ATPase
MKNLNGVLDQLRTQFSAEQRANEEAKRLLDEHTTTIQRYDVSTLSLKQKIEELELSIDRLVKEKEVTGTDAESRMTELQSSLSAAHVDINTYQQQYQSIKLLNEELRTELVQLQNQLEENNALSLATATEKDTKIQQLQSALEGIRRECWKLASQYNDAREAHGEDTTKSFEDTMAILHAKKDEQFQRVESLMEQAKALQEERSITAAAQQELTKQIDSLTIKYTESQAEVEQLRHAVNAKDQLLKESEEMISKGTTPVEYNIN